MCGCRFGCRRWQIYKKPSVRRLSCGIFLLCDTPFMRIYAKNAKEYSFRIFRLCRSSCRRVFLPGGVWGWERVAGVVVSCLSVFSSLCVGRHPRTVVSVPLFVVVSSREYIRYRPCVLSASRFCVQHASNCVQSLASCGGSNASLNMRPCLRSGCLSPTPSPYPLSVYCAFTLRAAGVRRSSLRAFPAVSGLPPAVWERGGGAVSSLRPMNTSSLYLSATQTSLNKPNLILFYVLSCVL